MTQPRVKRSRHKAAQRQNYCCYYCTFPMWEQGAADFASLYNITPAEARRFQCTAEHLHALGDGGTSRADNIVAACIYCNRLRHRRKGRISAETYIAYVRRRVARHAWQPPWLHKLRGGKVATTAQATQSIR